MRAQLQQLVVNDARAAAATRRRDCPAPWATAGRGSSLPAAGALSLMPRAPRDAARSPRHNFSVVCRASDYMPNSIDSMILQQDPKTALEPADIKRVFGFSRDLKEKYTVGRIIGAGSYGIVRVCTEVASGNNYAVKTVRKGPRRGKPTPRYLIKLRTEVEIMQQLGNSLDAVNLKEVFEDDEEVHLVMELCHGGALMERLRKGSFGEGFVARTVRGILRFISQCHAKGVIYRDVKPDNFLFLTTERDSPLKATDFGLSIKRTHDDPKLQSRAGTAAYMAPELIAQSYDEKCDLWSVGMMTYQLLTGRFPFWEDARRATLPEMTHAISNNEIDWNAQELQQLSQPAIDLLKGLLERDPAKRLSACAALEHPWIAQQSAAGEDKPLAGSVVQRLQRFSTYGTLKQIVLKMMVDEMTGSSSGFQLSSLSSQDLESMLPVPVADLQALFRNLDTDGSGCLSKKEMAVGLRQQGYVLNDSEVEQLMRRVDIDNSGSVCAAEFLTSFIDWSQVQQSLEWEALVNRVFRKLDKDGDGTISVDELVEHLKRCDAGVADADRLAEAKQMLREADASGDGLICKEEFTRLLEEVQRPDSLSFYDDRLAFLA